MRKVLPAAQRVADCELAHAKASRERTQRDPRAVSRLSALVERADLLDLLRRESGVAVLLATLRPYVDLGPSSLPRVPNIVPLRAKHQVFGTHAPGSVAGVSYHLSRLACLADEDLDDEATGADGVSPPPEACIAILVESACPQPAAVGTTLNVRVKPFQSRHSNQA